ncbi:hypothetical protein QR680_004482 [Steinernema hermaphroditum]|uniref:Uncharacterized protein n=1 Tax=Steinernema hermaphroditum TaxID=289476 RepID=A0AA39LT90_9BILA|nr:hypothetical protein QR680_004482 [Steinernema hermaphroditum]
MPLRPEYSFGAGSSFGVPSSSQSEPRGISYLRHVFVDVERAVEKLTEQVDHNEAVLERLRLVAELHEAVKKHEEALREAQHWLFMENRAKKMTQDRRRRQEDEARRNGANRIARVALNEGRRSSVDIEDGEIESVTSMDSVDLALRHAEIEHELFGEVAEEDQETNEQENAYEDLEKLEEEASRLKETLQQELALVTAMESNLKKTWAVYMADVDRVAKLEEELGVEPSGLDQPLEDFDLSDLFDSDAEAPSDEE